MPRRSADINVMVRAAERAGRALIRDFGEVDLLQVSRKGPGDFVTAADLKAEKIVKEELKKGRPEFGFLMEESGRASGSDKSHVWIVDPLDGTTNFLHGLPHFCVSIGLTRDNEVIAGVVFDPIKDEVFWTERGVGAFVNNRRLRVSGRTLLDEAILATGVPFNRNDQETCEQFIDQLRSVMKRTAGIRRYGSAALDLAYVAAGRYDGFWENGLHPWDVAAGLLLVREAGGFVTNLRGSRYELGAEDILATNDGLNRKLSELLIRKSG
ncbi:MAG: Inositol-1-monophosphatase [Alphaproteobacteria bacterium MarineAlpha4_Bin2]|nr:MAG: Inositol-1-monophosphatase [Alphaproteobacteria bacterium MarineAlpha4_Bin2]